MVMKITVAVLTGPVTITTFVSIWTIMMTENPIASGDI